MQYDIVFMVSSGIGNVLEMLYAVEYVMHKPELKVGMYIEKVPKSFLEYLKSCYPEIIIEDTTGVKTKHLVHSLTVEKHIPISFEHYFYIKPDRYSSDYLSETEQALSVVKALYPGGNFSPILKNLKSSIPTGIGEIEISRKTILYPGCSSINPVKRWPYFQDLIKKLGEENVLLLGGKDDLDFSASYIYPKWFAKIAPQAVLNNKSVWNIFKKLSILKPYAHWKGMEKLPFVFIERFSWAELVWLFQHAKNFVGNDGGIMHLAAASGANGLAIFGPTSIEKNKPLNPNIQIVSKKTPCAPCQFAVGGIQMTKGYINCPFQIKCLTGISADEVILILKNNSKAPAGV